jgi:TPR repeat protein
MPGLQAAAAKDEVFAQMGLGRCYLEGWGVTKDEAEAVRWLKRAAEQKHAGSRCTLGVCYE